MKIPARQLKSGNTCPAFHVSEHHAKQVEKHNWHLAVNGRYLCGRPYGGKQKVYLHHYVWELEHGSKPDGLLLDHINRNTLDNRIENLRLADDATNNRNTTARKRTQDLPRNVYYKAGKYVVSFTVNGKSEHLGRYDTLEEAKPVAAVARKILCHMDAMRSEALAAALAKGGGN